MDQKLNSIQPPPSVDDLLALGSDLRVGQVDFANPISPSTGLEGRIQDPSAAPSASVTSVLPRRRVQVAPEPEPEVTPEPDVTLEIEPEADATVEAEAERTDPVEDQAPTGLAPRPRSKPAAKATRTPRPSPRPAARKAATPKPAAAKPAARTRPPAVLPVADLSGDDAFTEPTPAPAPTYGEPARASEDLGALGSTVQEVADAAIERLRDAENATLQHLRALEVEAARRTELLTAQAELDAELIRITARREAHAIISAARTQAGIGGQNTREGRQLAEISDAVSRFAESIEGSLAPLRSSADQGDQR